MNNKCVYIYLDHRKPGNYVYEDLFFDYEPIYVGKGNLNRPKRHKILYKNNVNRFYSKLISIVENTNMFPNYIIFKDNLTEEEANTEEINLIKKIGRIEQNGPLTNMSDGGDGQSGWIMPDSVKLKKSISMSGKKFGPITEETRRKISESKKGKPNNCKGKTMSDESKKKMSEAKKGKYIGIENWNYGKKLSEEEKSKSETWKLTDKNNNEIIIKNLNKFCVDNNLNRTCMNSIYYGKHKSHKQWIKVEKIETKKPD